MKKNYLIKQLDFDDIWNELFEGVPVYRFKINENQTFCDLRDKAISAIQRDEVNHECVYLTVVKEGEE